MVTIRADGFIEPCIPTLAANPPSGPGWVHEIKHDGYRLIVRRDGGTARLFTRRGHDWTDRYPAIADPELRAKPVTGYGDGGIDGRPEGADRRRTRGLAKRSRAEPQPGTRTPGLGTARRQPTLRDTARATPTYQ
jgi:ATP dependent DNA ligase domain